MLLNRLKKFTGIETSPSYILLRDGDDLWKHSEIEGSLHGYTIRQAKDSVDLRYYYEMMLEEHTEQIIILYEGSYIPYDIQSKMQVIDVSFPFFYPNLDAHILRQYPNIQQDVLEKAYSMWEGPCNNTSAFLDQEIWSEITIREVSEEYVKACQNLLQQDLRAKDWFCLSEWIGFIELAARMRISIEGRHELHDEVNEAFSQWLEKKYTGLSQESIGKQPFIANQVVHHMAYYYRKHSANCKKLALVVMDGMSFADFHLIRYYLRRQPYMHVTGMFSQIPSITSVSRQSIFSGKLPREHDKPFDSSDEERQWREFWREQGLKDSEIYYAKNPVEEIPMNVHVAGVVVNFIDEQMHHELQSGQGMYSSLKTWLESGELEQFMMKLRESGYTIFMTADHGNTTAQAVKRLKLPHAITENGSRRAVIYEKNVGTQELEDFPVQAYPSAFMPDDYSYYVFDSGACFGDRDKEYVSHGGITIEEVVVPFIRIGDE